MAGDSTMILVNELHKSYQLGNTQVQALRGVSLRIEAGERVFLGGPSGSGKSTLLHILGCLDRADRGEVIVAGLDINRTSDRSLADFRSRKIGFIFQNFNLLPVLTVYENVEYPLLLAGVRERRRPVAAILDQVGLAAYHHHYPNALSGGQRQRVAIARALVHQPRLVIADEPTANLDSVTGNQVMAVMLELSRAQGVTLLLCTHNTELLAQAEQLILLRDGRIDPPLIPLPLPPQVTGSLALEEGR